ncbi:hypothetical protein RD792_005613 [Penstemon davidsonii]|uniref:Peptidase C1A papain C-terminal domain-containing protein n=1 Tax=Penstemon davidsonii TaxID=160366 RepID=A0ABR0DEQ5_9LAMI|nr:hypothetical protein RD792_005613 [Penstemon davidsonii]
MVQKTTDLLLYSESDWWIFSRLKSDEFDLDQQSVHQTNGFDQQSGSSCWAFSAVAAILGISFIRSGELNSLSEQHILDCTSAAIGCQGGWMDQAFEFVMNNAGFACDTDYPYQASKEFCYVDMTSSLAVTITGFEHVPPSNETAMALAVANQPVAVTIDPGLLQFYRSGVVTGACGTSGAHAVAIVGYGTSEVGTRFWLGLGKWDRVSGTRPVPIGFFPIGTGQNGNFSIWDGTKPGQEKSGRVSGIDPHPIGKPGPDYIV